LAGIPALVAQGLRKADIARQLGCKESTLQVRCCNAGISLRGGPKRLKLRNGVPLTLSRETVASLGMRAAADGRSEGELVSDLLETIARDGLYDAVLDSAPPPPANSSRQRFEPSASSPSRQLLNASARRA
jgi:hypothetical protein